MTTDLMPFEKLNMSARLLYLEAKKRGINPFIINEDTLLHQYQGKKFFTKGSRSSFQSSIGLSIANDKELSKQVLKIYDIPTANYVTVDKRKRLKRIKQLDFPLVMKPLKGHQGEGVIVNIPSYSKARVFFIQAKANNEEKLLFEEMLAGQEYRILVVDNKFLAATYRKPAFVVGDGKKTIQELIDEKNADPRRGKDHLKPLSMITVDDLVLMYLNQRGLSLISIPEKGEEIPLRKTSNLSTGGEPTNVTDLVCEENKKFFEKIAEVSDLNIIGIDVMCQSLAEPLEKQKGAGIVEINSSPGLRMHHYPVEGEPIDVAKIIMDSILEKLN